MNDYMGIKAKAIAKKLDIAKLLTDIYQHNGDVKGALSESTASLSGGFDIKKIRQVVDESYGQTDKPKKIEIKK